MVPLTFLASLIALTLLALAGQSLERRRVHRTMRKLAAQWKMHYAGADRFQITPRVRENFPVPGASDVVVADLLYRQEAELYRYYFTVEYTLGVIRTKHRIRRAATFCEPRDRSGGACFSPLVFAPENLPLLEQYAHLVNGAAKEAS
jgi:hypothetical protein